MQLLRHLGLPTTQGPFDPAHTLTTSPVLSPPALAALRLLLALYTLTTLIATLVWNCVKLDQGSGYFSYFTYLTYTGLCAYFWAAGVQTLVFARRSNGDQAQGRGRDSGGGGGVGETGDMGVREKGDGDDGMKEDGAGGGGGGGGGVLVNASSSSSSSSSSYPLQRWPQALQFLHLLLLATITTFPILVTIVFWALLSGPDTLSTPYSAYSNLSVHALNTLFALTEITLTNTPPAPWLLLPCGILLLACYLGVAYITHATQGFYPYSFLNPTTQKGLLAAYIVGIAVAYCIVFSVVRGAVCLRRRIAVGRWGGVGAGAGAGAGSSVEELEREREREREREALDEWEEVEVPKDVGIAL